MPQFAGDEGLLDCYTFIVDLGSASTPCHGDLHAFHEKWVDPRLRKLRLKFFGVLNAFPLEFPWIKIGFAKAAYREGPNSYGFVMGYQHRW